MLERILYCSLILGVIFIGCESRKDPDFDFSHFESAGMACGSNKKLLIYINLHATSFSQINGLDFSCMMGLPYKLRPYLESEKHDVLFLIDTPEAKLGWLETKLESWCFADNYLITHSTPSFFKRAKAQRVQWLSCFFDEHGVFVDHTNPSLPNFKVLMGPEPD